MLKLVSLKYSKDLELVEHISNGLVCLMLASKIQDSNQHLKVSDVVSLVQKFVEDNRRLKEERQLADP